MQRTCVGCRGVDEPNRLVRVFSAPQGKVVVDLQGRALGRGAWLHPSLSCLRKAVGSSLSRALRTRVEVSFEELTQELSRAAHRRARGLLLAAKRARSLEAGSTAVEASVRAGHAELLLLATDARAASEHAFLRPFAAEGRAVGFGTKAWLGECLNRPDTALLAVTDPRLSRELRRAIDWATITASTGASSPPGLLTSPEPS